ncbi:MAG: molybdopterin-dependent oxidoreductase [Actinomycetales bacterium]
MTAALHRRMDQAGRFYASPVRGTRLTVVLGRALATVFLLCFVTGVFSHLLQDPPSWMVYPLRPVWIYQLTQGVHITAGIASIPLLLAKLWSVFPNLLAWPPVRGVAHGLERASIALFVSSSLVEVTIGLINTYKWYPWPFPFRQTHYWLAWVIIGSLAVHIAVKLPLIAAHWRRPSATAAMPREGAAAAAHAGATDAAGAVATAHSTGTSVSATATGEGAVAAASPGRWSRRGFLGGVTAATTLLVVTTAGQSFAALGAFNIFAPRRQGTGPQNVPVNRTSEAAGVATAAGAADWVLRIHSRSHTRSFSRAELGAMPQATFDLPVACVEGWSQNAAWTGVPIRDLLAAIGAAPDSDLRITSLEKDGFYRQSTMPAAYSADPQTLVALALNGETLDLEHGFPARVMAPGRPGVLQTKWLADIEVLA